MLNRIVLIISTAAFCQQSMALTCTSTPVPLTTINRCDTVRTHPGEVKGENYKLGNQTYNLWAAPQTYDQLFTVQCTDACGNSVAIIDEVDWDCVGNQEIAALGSNTPDSYQPYGEAHAKCPAESGTSNASQDFQKYMDAVSPNEQIKPPGMPASQQGIGYWDGE